MSGGEIGDVHIVPAAHPVRDSARGRLRLGGLGPNEIRRAQDLDRFFDWLEAPVPPRRR